MKLLSSLGQFIFKGRLNTQINGEVEGSVGVRRLADVIIKCGFSTLKAKAARIGKANDMSRSPPQGIDALLLGLKADAR